MMHYANLSTFASSLTMNRINKVPFYKLGVLFTMLFYTFIGFIIYSGWRFSKYELITAERGTGYCFGIIGAVLMLLLVLYPLRKRIHALSLLGSNKLWFILHMVLGVVGPVCILFHANFGLGSLNSQLALVSMIIVAVSGIVGRYIHTRFHYDLSGQMVNLAKLRDKLKQEECDINHIFADLPEIRKKLIDFAEEMLKPPGSLLNSIIRLFVAGYRAQFILWKMRRIVKIYMNSFSDSNEVSLARKKKIWHMFMARIRRYFTFAFRVTKFNCYERLFSYWRVLHVPFAFLMAIAVVVHVVAVNIF